METRERPCRTYFNVIEDKVRKDLSRLDPAEELVGEHEIVLEKKTVLFQDVALFRIDHRVLRQARSLFNVSMSRPMA